MLFCIVLLFFCFCVIYFFFLTKHPVYGYMNVTLDVSMTQYNKRDILSARIILR